MDLKDDFHKGADWVRDNLSLHGHQYISFFETTIRILGGILSAYDLSGRKDLLDKAVEVGDMLMVCYTQSKTGLPLGYLKMGHCKPTSWSPGIAEVGSNQLEFRQLSFHTGDPKYQLAADGAAEVLHGLTVQQPLLPRDIAGDPPKPRGMTTIASKADSYFEYLLKVWLHTNKTEPVYKEDWINAMNTALHKLLEVTSETSITYFKDVKNSRDDHLLYHLGCFIAGNLMQGARTIPQEEVNSKWEEVAKELGYTCFQMYNRTVSGVAPEVTKFQKEGSPDMLPGEQHYYALRPETIESVYILHYYTRDPKYRLWGATMFEATERNCRVKYGYATLKDVHHPEQGHENTQETFWMGETLKYYYLLFSNGSSNGSETVNLEDWVFNTEAHPLRVWKDDSLVHPAPAPTTIAPTTIASANYPPMSNPANNPAAPTTNPTNHPTNNPTNYPAN
eukprot:Platyproteum_vivax@DN6548_c0_g1_i2.p1